MATTTITIDIDELRSQIKIDQKNLEENQAVLRYLEKRESVTQHSSKPEPTHFTLNGDPGIIELSQLVQNKRPRTFITEVKDVIESFGRQEFSMEHIDAALSRKGAANSKYRRSNITSVLGKLEKRRFITRTFNGTGNVQNKYKRVQERAVLLKHEHEEVSL